MCLLLILVWDPSSVVANLSAPSNYEIDKLRLSLWSRRTNSEGKTTTTKLWYYKTVDYFTKSEQHHIVRRHTLLVESVSSVFSISLPVSLYIFFLFVCLLTHRTSTPYMPLRSFVVAQHIDGCRRLLVRCCLEFTRISILRLNNFCRCRSLAKRQRMTWIPVVSVTLSFERQFESEWHYAFDVERIPYNVFGQMGASSLHEYCTSIESNVATSNQVKK